jgi:hypothetical protein
LGRKLSITTGKELLSRSYKTEYDCTLPDELYKTERVTVKFKRADVDDLSSCLRKKGSIIRKAGSLKEGLPSTFVKELYDEEKKAKRRKSKSKTETKDKSGEKSKKKKKKVEAVDHEDIKLELSPDKKGSPVRTPHPKKHRKSE